MFKKARPDANIVYQSPDLLTAQTAEEFRDRGWLFYAQKDYDKAEADFNDALRLDPDDLDAIYALGLTLKASGQASSAVEWFKKAAETSEYLENRVRGRMLRRLALGHIHEIQTGDWNLEKETWHVQS